MRKKAILEQYPPKMENVLLILHAFQNHSRWNYLSKQDLALIAGHLNITLGTIYGIASYYSMFSLEPRGRHLVRICRSPVCHLTGAVDLLSELTRTLEIDVGATTADRLFTLETVECLGLCEMAPAMMIDDVPYGNLSGDKIRHIIGSLRKRKGRHGQGGR